MKVEVFSKRKRDMKNVALWSITTMAVIVLMFCIMTVESLIRSVWWWTALLLSGAWLVLFGRANDDRWC